MEKGEIMVNLDHAATTPVRPEVLEAMMPFFTNCAANASGLYAEGRRARQAVDHARMQLADALHVRAQEVYFTSGGSEADNWALFGVTRALPEKKHIVTTQIEHHAVLHACEALKQMGWDVSLVGVRPDGFVDPEEIERAIRPDTALVSVMMANNEIGTIQPIREIAERVHAHGVLMHTDAVQAVGHIPVHVEELGVDLLSLSGHKFGGPKGTGALIVKNGVRLTNLIYGGAQERGLRAGTENTPGIVGIGKAAELAVQELPISQKKTAALRDRLMNGILSSLPSARVNGSLENRLPGNLHLTFDNADTSLLLMRLDMEGIAASAGSACASGAVERSHVMTAIGAPQGADLRLTIGVENTEEEISQTISALVRILKG